MKYNRLNPSDFPMDRKETWWIVDLNMPSCEFWAPPGAMAFCIKDLTIPLEREETFNEGTLYSICSNDKELGFITVRTLEELVEMPYYVFARYFDAESFIRGIPTRQEQKKIDLENFND